MAIVQAVMKVKKEESPLFENTRSIDLFVFSAVSVLASEPVILYRLHQPLATRCCNIQLIKMSDKNVDGNMAHRGGGRGGGHFEQASWMKT